MELTIDQALQIAVEAHATGKLQDAEALYRTILQSEPHHPDANHNLGVMAVSVNITKAALPLFKTALEANPNHGQFWISYVDALIKDEQFDNAKSLLDQGKKLGLQGENVKALDAKLRPLTFEHELGSSKKNNDPSFTQQLNRISKKKIKANESLATHNYSNQISSPTQIEVDALAKNLQEGRYDLAENLAIHITQQYPKHPFGWKVLSAVFREMGKLPDSLIANQRELEISPNDAEAHNSLGNTLKELNRPDDALKSYRNAIAIKAAYAEAHYNLGIMLTELGRLAEAAISYKNATAINPAYADAYINLGGIFRKLGSLEEAVTSYKNAITTNPNYAEAHSNLGIALQDLGRLEQAVTSHQTAIEINPAYAEAHYNLGVSLTELGRLEEAVISYKKAISINSVFAEKCSHIIAASSGVSPARANDAYVVDLFDGYAKNFEFSLLENLNYKAPTIISNYLRTLIPSNKFFYDILDLGSGTGLAGEALFDLAKTLVGIDLSREMLEIASKKKIYSRLVQDEIHHALDKEQSASFDIIVSSDVFIYIGDLKSIFDSTFKILKPGGFFAYSTEALLPEGNESEADLIDFKLNASGRYSHSSNYLLNVIDHKKLKLKVLKVEQIRHQNGRPVMGHVVVMQKQIDY